MKRTILIIFLLLVILCGAQIAIFRAIELRDAMTINPNQQNEIKVRVLLGSSTADKFIPVLGLVRIISGKPCRVEATLKDQSASKKIEKLEDIDLDRVSTAYSADGVLIYIEGLDKPLELKMK